MVSSLASQLQQLREGGAGSKRKTDSFLYDAREAAQIDDETVYNLAWNGLLELKQLDAAFDAFDPSRDPAKLFSRQRIHFHRVQITTQEDAELSAALAKLLDALSPYFLLGATHKVLEFLVRRYDIHRHNVDDVMATIVGYHESTWFAKMVKILHIHQTRWEFLLQVKQTEEPLLRAALVQRAIDEHSVLAFVFEAATRIGSSNPKLISLYALVVLQMLDQTPVNEPLLRWLIPDVLLALKTKQFPEMQAAAYMIVTKLSSKAVLSTKVVETLVKHLVKYAHNVGGGVQLNALLCVIYVAETQPSFVLTPSVGKYLVTMDNLVDFLAEAASNYESATFVRSFVVYLVDAMQGDAIADDAAYGLVVDIVTRVGVVEYIVADLMTTLHTVAAEHNYDLDHSRVQAASGVLVAISKKYVDKADRSVQTLMTMTADSATKKEKKKLVAFLETTFGQVANSAHFVPSTADAKTSLALALDHVTESTRFQALQTLLAQHETASTDERVLTSPGILLRRLHDDSARIVKLVATSSLSDLLLQLCSKKKALEAIAQVVHKWSGSLNASVVIALMELLVTRFRRVFSADTDDKILVLLLSLLPLTTASTAKKPKSNATEASPLSFAHVWTWVAQLEHPFAKALAAVASSEPTTVQLMAQRFGQVLAEKDLTKFLPFCLGWSTPSEMNPRPLTAFLIPVLGSARTQLHHHHHRKTKAKTHTEHSAALDQALRFVVKKEFVRLCRDTPIDKTSAAYILEVAQLLSAVAIDTFAVDVHEFDACVFTLLQAPARVFQQIQGALGQIFQTDEHALDAQLLATMSRVIVKGYSNVEDADLLTVLAKVRALEIASAVLEGDEDDQDHDDIEHVLPVIVVALGDTHVRVRETALGCLERWVASTDGNVTATGVQAIVSLASFLLTARGDILMDTRAVVTLCGSHQQEDGHGFADVVVRVASKASDHDLSLSVKLLGLLAEVANPCVWEKTTAFTERLLSSLSDDDSDVTTKQKTAILKLLVGHYLSADYTTKAVKKTTKNVFFEVMLHVLRCDQKQLALRSELQTSTLVRLRTAYFLQLDDVAQHLLVSTLLSLLMVAEETVASQVIRCLSELPLTAAMFVRLLKDEIANKRIVVGSTKGPTRQLRKTSADSKTEREFFQELSCILEVLAIKVDDLATEHENENESGATALLQILTEVLAVLCLPEHADRVSEYILQIVFGCLRRVCEVHAFGASESISTKPMTSVQVEPEHLVKHTLVCLGRTASPQTRNEALLFISALVNVYPTSVLSSLDKILGFLGSGAIHQDDEYSFNVLETIVKAVVPHILQDAATSSTISPQQFIRLFVDAYDQLPLKRRALLFHVLVQSLGHEFLPHTVVAILQNGVLAELLDDRVKFAHHLSCSFDAVTQMAALVTQLRFMKDLHAHVLDDAETDTDGMDDEDDDDDDEKLDDALRFQWDVRVTTSQPIARKLNLAIAKFIPAHLQARELHHQILRLEEQDDAMEEAEAEEIHETASDRLQQHYLVLAQVVLLYFRRVAREQTVHEDGASSSDVEVASRGFWGELGQQTIEILSALQQLLSTPGFVAVISELLHHDNALVRKKAMQLFNERLQDDRSSLTPGEEMLFLDMVEELDTILQNADGAESSVNIQTALLSVDILARNFAAQHTKRFQVIVPTIIKYVSLDVSTKASASSMALHLMGCAYVSLSSVCRAVGPLVFPFLPKFFPNLLAAIEFCTQKSKKHTDATTTTTATATGGVKTVLQCLLAALEVFTDHIPQFLTPYLSKIVAALLLPSSSGLNSSTATTTTTAMQQQQLSVDACFLNLTNHVEMRHLLPSLFGSYELALTHGDASLEKLFSVVSTVVSGLNAANLRQYLPQFARFFVTSLDLRRVHAHRLQDLEAVEDDALDVLVQFVLRLNEKQLKPLFLKIAEWAQHVKTPHGEIARRIVFFRLLIKLSERLKSIFVPYYAHVLDLLTRALRDSRDVLATKKASTSKTAAGSDLDSNSDSAADDDDDFFAVDSSALPTRKKRKLTNGRSTEKADAPVARETVLLQLQLAVRALNGCFVHDSDGFMDKDKFDAVMAPLVDTVDVLKHTPAAREFVLETVAECVANLAWAAKNDLLWKPLHYAVLMKSRGDCAVVRLATLKIVDKCYSVIGDEFLAMLPESIPFLAELMEDNDAEVERTCHAVIKQIEDISGESLDQYLAA